MKIILKSRSLLLIISLVLLTLTTQALAKDELTKVVLKKINDGDTIVVQIQNRNEHVRLIGIDTPESYQNPKAERDAQKNKLDLPTILELGKKSTNFLHSIIKAGDPLFLEFDIEQRDKYGRLLAYVFLENGTFLNEKILASGYGLLYSVSPNLKYTKRLARAVKSARDNKLGLWRPSKGKI